MVRQAAAQRSPDSATQALQRNAGVSASACPGVPGALPGCFWLLRLLLGRPGNAQDTPGSRPARRRLSQPGPTTLFMKRRWLSVLRGSCGAWGSPGSSRLSLAAPGVLRAGLGDSKHALRTTARGSSQNDSQQRDFKHSARRRKYFLGHRVGSQAWGTPQRIQDQRLEAKLSREFPTRTQKPPKMTHFSVPGRFRRRGLRDSVFPVSELLFELPYSGNALRVICPFRSGSSFPRFRITLEHPVNRKMLYELSQNPSS